MKELKAIVVNTTAVLLVCLLGLFFIEIFLRAFVPVHITGHVGVYQYHEELGLRLKDAIEDVKVTDHRQEIRTNTLGTINYQDNTEGYNKTIFAIGDSYTQGTGLPADMSYPMQLDLKLNLQDGIYNRNFAVVNLGFAAYGLEQSTIALKRYAELLGNPQYVLYLGDSGDAKDDTLFLAGYHHRHLVDGNPRWGIWLGALQFLSNELETGKRLKIILSRIRHARITGKAKKAKTGEGSKIANRAIKLEQSLERLKQITESMNARLIVAWAKPPSEQSTSYEWLQNWAAENSAGFADWAPMVKSVQENIPALPVTNSHSAGHYRSWVNGLLADAFKLEITNQN